MTSLELSPDQRPLALAALRAVGTGGAGEALSVREQDLLAARAAELGHTGSLDALPAHDPVALARMLPEPERREALVRELVLMAMIDGEVDPAAVATARSTARALAVRQPAIHQLELFLRGRLRRLGFDLMRRSFLASQLKRVWREQGLRGIFRVMRQMRGKPDAKLAARYLALGDLPEGTLGRALFDHFRAAEFALPGEQGSAPETLLFHDLGHALTGYGTDPEGEVQMAGFEAGYMGGSDGFSVTLLGLYLFHLGADINPTAKPARGAFARAPFEAAAARGAGMGIDLRDWDPWPHMARPLSEVRADLHC
tara:strand:- start:79 stop:1014 length:936 start_codon:yes stop_codon:yes gene_type:complete